MERADIEALAQRLLGNAAQSLDLQLPLPAHGPCWRTCLELAVGEEAYRETCPEGVAPEVAAAGVAAIVSHPDIRRTLTEWTGFAGACSTRFIGQIAAAERALVQIDAELETPE